MADKLQSPVLVLNSSWTPITIVSASRAIGMLIRERARVVSEDYSTYDFDSWADLGKLFDKNNVIKTQRLVIPIPEVLILSKYTKVHYEKVPFTRSNLLSRDKHICQYCGKHTSLKKFTIDHVMPRSRGGQTVWENCVVACITCNTKKRDKTPQEAHMVLLKKPAKPAPRKIMHGIEVISKKVSWDKFISDPEVRDEVASAVYWNAKLKEA